MVAVMRMSRWRRSGVGEFSRRWLRFPDRLGFSRVCGCRWGGVATVQLVNSAAGPHLLFIAQCDGGPPTI
jgi:hypothetical protein